MRAGQLRHRIAIQRPVVTPDPDTGIVQRSWAVVVASVAASLDPISGREFFAADQRQSAVTTKCLLRWRNGIDATMRVVHGDVVYAIRAVLPDATNRRSITLMLERGTTDGN